MYQFYQNTLTLPARALYEDLDIMSESNYKQLCSRGLLRKVVTAGGLNNPAKVDFDSIPERFKIQIVKKLGYPPKKNTQNLILNHYNDDYEAQDFYANYLLDDYRTLPAATQQEYTINAQMLQAIDYYIKEMVTFRKSRGGKSALTKIWEDAALASEDVKEQIGHTLPKSVRRLKEKLDEFKKEGYSALISENFGNKKAAKVKDSQQEAVLRELLRKWQNFDNVQIADQYNAVAKALGWDTISDSTVANFRKKNKMLIIPYNSGLKTLNNNIKMQVKRKAPEFPMAYWTLDGWKCELLYQKFENGKTTYHNRLTAVVVLDAATKYPIGYAIGDRENTNLIKAALRNAINHTEELFGFKHQAYQIQADNYGSKIMAPIYKGVAKNYIPTKVGNAKAKIIEPWFRFFNKNYCQFENNWSGQGVKSRQQPNSDYLQKNRKNFPTEAEAYLQIERLLEKARADVKDQYIQAYNNAPSDLKIELNHSIFLKHLGVKKPDTTKFRGDGMVFTINKFLFSYDSFDLEFRRYIHLDWDIFFDPQNMEKVLAFNEEKNISFLLEEKYLQPMDLYSQEREDRNQLERVKKFNRELEFKISNEFSEDAEILLDMVFDNKVIDPTLEKLIITDNVGQHKDLKAKQLNRTAQKLLEKQDKKEQKQIEKTWSDEQTDYLTQKIDFSKYLQNE